jgi:AcrR family transcriptional regulator
VTPTAPRPAATPDGDRPRPARDRLLTAAADLVYAGGVEATGVDAIAARAQVTKRTLYQHFGSKADLVAAALDAADRPTVAALGYAVLRRATDTGERPILVLFDVLEPKFHRSDWRGCGYVNATLEVADPAHPVHPVARRHLAERRELVEQLLKASHAPSGGPLADAVQLIMEGAIVMSAANRDPLVARRAKAAVERLLLVPWRGK